MSSQAGFIGVALIFLAILTLLTIGWVAGGYVGQCEQIKHSARSAP